MPGRILIVDDDEDARRTIERMLVDEGNEVWSCCSGKEALQTLKLQDVEVVVTDVHMPSIDGLQLCQHVANNYPDIPVIVMTAYGDLSTAAAAIRADAFSFLNKPFAMDLLLEGLETAFQQHRGQSTLRRLPMEPETEALTGLIGSSAAMHSLRSRAQRLARSDSTVLITGESGTGKELIARALHRCSPRQKGPFVAVNCAAIPAELLAAELFGHVRGAFTGATEARQGLFEAANCGTLFLDEISSMPSELQAALLRVLEDTSVRPVGGYDERTVNVRIVAATNQPLETCVRQGTFRADLFYRLSSLGLHVPPLRERDGDVEELARHFLDTFSQERGSSAPTLSREVIDLLRRHHWPGNVRELQNVIQAALAFAVDGCIEVEHLPSSLSPEDKAPASSSRRHGPSLDEIERQHIAQVLASVGGNKTAAAQQLGIDRSTLYRKMKRHGL